MTAAPPNKADSATRGAVIRDLGRRSAPAGGGLLEGDALAQRERAAAAAVLAEAQKIGVEIPSEVLASLAPPQRADVG